METSYSDTSRIVKDVFRMRSENFGIETGLSGRGPGQLQLPLLGTEVSPSAYSVGVFDPVH